MFAAVPGPVTTPDFEPFKKLDTSALNTITSVLLVVVAVWFVLYLIIKAFPQAKYLIVAAAVLGGGLFVKTNAESLTINSGMIPRPGIFKPAKPAHGGHQKRPVGTARIATAARVAYDVGCRGRGLETAVAVAIAESGARPRAHNPRPPDNSYGLWQINMLGGLGPARRARFHIRSNEALFDPRVNARAMYRISHGCRRWRAWTTHTSGAYRGHLGQARAAIRRVK